MPASREPRRIRLCLPDTNNRRPKLAGGGRNGSSSSRGWGQQCRRQSHQVAVRAEARRMAALLGRMLFFPGMTGNHPTAPRLERCRAPSQPVTAARVEVTRRMLPKRPLTWPPTWLPALLPIRPALPVRLTLQHSFTGVLLARHPVASGGVAKLLAANQLTAGQAKSHRGTAVPFVQRAEACSACVR